jgi:hypothetical protein
MSEQEKMVGLWFEKAQADLIAANILFESNPSLIPNFGHYMRLYKMVNSSITNYSC